MASGHAQLIGLEENLESAIVAFTVLTRRKLISTKKMFL